MDDYSTENNASEQIQHEYDTRAQWELLYKQRKPEPESPKAKRRWDGQILLFAFIGAAASIFAALRTFPVFQEIGLLTVDSFFAGVEGALATVFVDLAVMTFRFVWVRMAHKGREKEARLTGWIKAGWAFAVLTQVVVQFYAVRDIATVFQDISLVFELAIAFAAALSSIILAFVVGEIIAVLFMDREGKYQVAVEAYEGEIKKHQTAMNAAWTREKPAYGVKRVVLERSRTFAEPVNSSDSSPSGRPEPTEAEWKVIKYLREHPRAANLSRKQLGNAVGVAKSTASTGARWKEYLDSQEQETAPYLAVGDALEDLPGANAVRKEWREER